MSETTGLRLQAEHESDVIARCPVRSIDNCLDDLADVGRRVRLAGAERIEVPVADWFVGGAKSVSDIASPLTNAGASSMS